MISMPQYFEFIDSFETKSRNASHAAIRSWSSFRKSSPISIVSSNHIRKLCSARSFRIE